MTTIVVLEPLAILLLGILVAGLLRSHAEILRRLHELGVGYGEEAGPGTGRGSGRGSGGVALTPTPRRGAAPTIAGVSPSGGAVAVGVDRPGERTLLLF